MVCEQTSKEICSSEINLLLLEIYILKHVNKHGNDRQVTMCFNELSSD